MQCSNRRCKNKASAIIRTKDVCDSCFNVLKKDNQIRIRNGINIPKTLTITKETFDNLQKFTKLRNKFQIQKSLKEQVYEFFQ